MSRNSLFCTRCLGIDIDTFYRRGQIIRSCNECNHKWIGEKLESKGRRKDKKDPVLIHESKLIIQRIEAITVEDVDFRIKYELLKEIDDKFLSLLNKRLKNEYFPLKQFKSYYNEEYYATYIRNRCYKMKKDLTSMYG